MFSSTLEKITNFGRGERAYNALERERLRTDQITEASERLNGAMENSFEYTYTNGELHFQGQPLRPIFERGIRNTEEIVAAKPWFGVELLRRHIELQQYEEQLALVEDVDWQDPLVLVHISPTPDAVLEEGVDLNAYDTERKKIMVRITEPTVDGVKVTSLSLDGNNRLALQSVGDFFGMDIPDGASSEDILSMHFLAEKSRFDGERPAKVLRQRYDDAMQAQYGGEWYAGRRDTDVRSTMQKIMQYPNLVEKHVDEVLRLKKRLGKNFRFTAEYDQATYNFLAAIEQSHKVGVAVTSIAAAGGVARAQGVKFSKPDCPTGTTAQTAEEALAAQGIGERGYTHYGTCQACLEKKLVGACYICKDCKAADDRGVDLMAVRRAALARLAMRLGETASPAKPETIKPIGHTGLSDKALFTDGYVKQLLGSNVKLHYRVAVGDSVPEALDSSGNIVVADLRRYAEA